MRPNRPNRLGLANVEAVKLWIERLAVARLTRHMAAVTCESAVDFVRGFHVLPVVHVALRALDRPDETLTAVQSGGWALACACIIALEAAHSIASTVWLVRTDVKRD